MLSLSSRDQIYLCTGHVDFRMQIKGLIKTTQRIIQENPYSGSYFIFTNRKKTAVKILHYDGQGYWMHLKMLSTGKFFWPKEEEGKIEMSPQQLQVLLMQGDPLSTSFQESWRKVA